MKKLIVIVTMFILSACAIFDDSGVNTNINENHYCAAVIIYVSELVRVTEGHGEANRIRSEANRFTERMVNGHQDKLVINDIVQGLYNHHRSFGFDEIYEAYKDCKVSL